MEEKRNTKRKQYFDPDHFDPNQKFDWGHWFAGLFAPKLIGGAAGIPYVPGVSSALEAGYAKRGHKAGRAARGVAKDVASMVAGGITGGITGGLLSKAFPRIDEGGGLAAGALLGLIGSGAHTYRGIQKARRRGEATAKALTETPANTENLTTKTASGGGAMITRDELEYIVERGLEKIAKDFNPEDYQKDFNWKRGLRYGVGIPSAVIEAGYAKDDDTAKGRAWRGVRKDVLSNVKGIGIGGALGTGLGLLMALRRKEPDLAKFYALGLGSLGAGSGALVGSVGSPIKTLKRIRRAQEELEKTASGGDSMFTQDELEYIVERGLEKIAREKKSPRYNPDDYNQNFDWTSGGVGAVAPLVLRVPGASAVFEAGYAKPGKKFRRGAIGLLRDAGATIGGGVLGGLAGGSLGDLIDRKRAIGAYDKGLAVGALVGGLLGGGVSSYKTYKRIQEARRLARETEKTASGGDSMFTQDELEYIVERGLEKIAEDEAKKKGLSLQRALTAAAIGGLVGGATSGTSAALAARKAMRNVAPAFQGLMRMNAQAAIPTAIRYGSSAGAAGGAALAGYDAWRNRRRRNREKTASDELAEAIEKIASYTGMDPDEVVGVIASHQEELEKLAEVDELVDQLTEEEAQKILDEAAEKNPKVAAALDEIEEREENERLAKVASLIAALTDEEAKELAGR